MAHRFIVLRRCVGDSERRGRESVTRRGVEYDDALAEVDEASSCLGCFKIGLGVGVSFPVFVVREKERRPRIQRESGGGFAGRVKPELVVLREELRLCPHLRSRPRLDGLASRGGMVIGMVVEGSWNVPACFVQLCPTRFIDAKAATKDTHL